MVYNTPTNVVRLLDDVVGAAAQTAFFRTLLPDNPRVSRMEDFFALPVTPLGRYREQRLADVVADRARVQWVAGRHGGQEVRGVALAEGVVETGARYDLLKDALRGAAPGRWPRTGAVITAPGRRYYAAEISSILGYLGVPAHVFIDHGDRVAVRRLREVRPDLLVVLSDRVVEADVPPSVALCVTFRASHRLSSFAQLDLYIVDEFGFLGHSTDLAGWILYNDQYYYEVSADRRLIVTALHNRTRPLLRLQTQDTVVDLGEHHLALGRLSERG
jgi:hypothetical protein